MEIRSSAFKNNEKIPRKYTCEGRNIHPPLEFIGVPKSAKSLAIIVDDPDSPSKIWSHWVLWGIPASTKEIPENALPEDAIEGVNDFGNIGYGGPCPHYGEHHYRFRLYALDIELNSTKEFTKTNLENAIKFHIIGEAVLTGTYSRSNSENL